jgi:hypothetical protein
MHIRGTLVRGLVIIGSTVLVAGCGIYLHDEGLQKQTDALLVTYKTADVAAALKAALNAQLELDKAELQAIADNETAERERAVADLIASYPLYGSGPAIERLKERVGDRIHSLAGTAEMEPDVWVGMEEKRISNRTLLDSLRRTLSSFQRRYAAAGGTNFSSCDTFGGEEGVAPDLQAAARQLKQQCGLVEDALRPNPAGQEKAALETVFAANGDIQTVHEARGRATERLKEATRARDEALKALRQAQQDLKSATKNQTVIDADGTKSLEALVAQLQQLENLFGSPDASAALGKALAAIQFRKGNLQDVLAASTGGDSSSSGSEVPRAIAGIIAGVITIADAGNAPSVPALSIALAYQDGLEKAALARLDVLTRTKALLEDQQDSLLRELELLAVARRAIVEVGEGLSSGACTPRGFAAVFQNANCAAAARVAGARALTAYHLSWASGRTAARLDDRKITQLITWQRLRTSQEAAVARSNIQLIALNEIAAYGQGGIKAETIAAFLQAFGIAAIAAGVN